MTVESLAGLGAFVLCLLVDTLFWSVPPFYKKERIQGHGLA